MRRSIALSSFLALGLFASAASADPAERGYQAQSNAVKGKFLAGEALFGQSIDDARGHKIAGEVVHGGLGCNQHTYPAELDGKVALLERGVCPFVEKVAKAQAAGAIAVVVYNSAAGGEKVVVMSGTTAPNAIGIPSAFVGRSHGIAMLEGGKPVTIQVKDKTRDKLETRDD